MAVRGDCQMFLVSWHKPRQLGLDHAPLCTVLQGGCHSFGIGGDRKGGERDRKGGEKNKSVGVTCPQQSITQ